MCCLQMIMWQETYKWFLFIQLRGWRFEYEQWQPSFYWAVSVQGKPQQSSWNLLAIRAYFPSSGTSLNTTASKRNWFYNFLFICKCWCILLSPHCGLLWILNLTYLNNWIYTVYKYFLFSCLDFICEFYCFLVLRYY